MYLPAHSELERVGATQHQQPLEHLPQIFAVNAGIESRDELHLCLTDYRSLYVAEVLAVEDGDKKTTDPRHTPEYYRRDNLTCDVWFKLGDIRALVNDDTLAVQAELRKLRVTSYNDRPVSLYGGMVNLPLLVTRPDGIRFFDDDERELLNDADLGVVADAARVGLGLLMADLRDNLFGVRAWSALSPTARTFVATAERLMRDHRRDASFDFATVLIELSKAIEVQVNGIIASALSGAPVPLRSGNVDGHSIDFSTARSQSVGQLSRVIAGDRERMDYLATHLTEGRWFTETLPPVLEELAPFRNESARLSEPPTTLEMCHESSSQRRVPMKLLTTCFIAALLVPATTVYAQEAPQTRHSGFHASFGLGAGSAAMTCSGCNSDRETSSSMTLRFGGAVSSNVVLSGEISGWSKDKSGVSTSLSFLTLSAQIYPEPNQGFFWKFGAGLVGANLVHIGLAASWR